MPKVVTETCLVHFLRSMLRDQRDHGCQILVYLWMRAMREDVEPHRHLLPKGHAALLPNARLAGIHERGVAKGDL